MYVYDTPAVSQHPPIILVDLSREFIKKKQQIVVDQKQACNIILCNL